MGYLKQTGAENERCVGVDQETEKLTSVEASKYPIYAS